MSPVSPGDRSRWRTVPDNLSMDHLRRMSVRAPQLLVEVDDRRRFAAEIPDRAKLTVGRVACDLVVDWDGAVSRTHLTIERLASLIVVEDVSTYGTIVSGRKAIGRTQLGDGDEILIGNTTLVVRLPTEMTEIVGTLVVGRSPAPPANLSLSPAELRVASVMIPVRTPDGELPAVPTNREIADRLGLSVETVRSHLRSMTTKLAAAGVSGQIDRTVLAELAAQGLLDGLPLVEDAD